MPALLAVGLEGCWGLLLCAVALPLAATLQGPDGRPLDDAAAAAREVLADRGLSIAVAGSILSIAFFNFFGISGARWCTYVCMYLCVFMHLCVHICACLCSSATNTY